MSQEQQYVEVKLSSDERFELHLKSLKDAGDTNAIARVKERKEMLGFGEFKVFLDKLGVARKKRVLA